MRIKLSYLTPLLAAGAAAAAIAAAPMAAATAAASPQSCSSVGAGSECQTPGNVQINDSPPAVADNYFGGGAYPGPYPVPFDEG